ncbi:Scr1 family TA system antitoxin-like transcriptional regulator [Streptomyces sp. NPDC048275]|uniref:Scr1 family TA system antitoxin-like transcriptional regulator n=1 Tax=Streptomyces sp. NPDC048275 TaxID=3155629 RepID=UPI0034069AF0
MPEGQREFRVRFRRRRQEILDREDLVYEAVIHEAALRIKKAGRGEAKRQLLHIVEQSERPQVAVRVVPFDVDNFRVGYAPTILGGPVP